MRNTYECAELLEENTPSSPFILFNTWFEEAKKSTIVEANAMVIASADKNAKPSARMVLLKNIFDEKGFVFYTNYESRKGIELLENPQVALLFHWDEQERQVRIEGMVEKLDEKLSDEYFLSRPVGSQLGAIASPQSQVIDNKQQLENLFEQANKLQKITRPINWGGYIVVANKIEFWQGRPNRMHDRIVYEKNNTAWKKYRLAP
jgi:pyridoxamine 5'-phosphate oxidase